MVAMFQSVINSPTDCQQLLALRVDGLSTYSLLLIYCLNGRTSRPHGAAHLLTIDNFTLFHKKFVFLFKVFLSTFSLDYTAYKTQFDSQNVMNSFTTTLPTKLTAFRVEPGWLLASGWWWYHIEQCFCVWAMVPRHHHRRRRQMRHVPS